MKLSKSFKFIVPLALTLCAVNPVSAVISTGSASSVKDLYKNTEGQNLVPVKIIADYRKQGKSGVLDLGTYSAEMLEKNLKPIIQFENSLYDGWKVADANGADSLHMACTCLIKKMDDGKLVMGRNMDLPNSFYPAYIFRTKGNGKDTYDTVNIGYVTPGPETFDQIAETSSMLEGVYNRLPFTSTDIMNSEGLVIEVNMRGESPVASSGTNPGAFRVSELNLPRLVADHCATIEDMLKYVKTLDVYTPHSKITSWHIFMCCMDKTGRYGVLEFVSNKIVWNEGKPGTACGQANFFWDQEAYKKSPEENGLGRWEELMKRYAYIKTTEDVEAAMQHIWYSNWITDGSMAKDWKVDWRSEWTGPGYDFVQQKVINSVKAWQEQYNIKVDPKEMAEVQAIADDQVKNKIIWDTEYLTSPHAAYNVFTVHDFYTKAFAQLPVDARKLSGMEEMSTINYVIDNKAFTYKLRLFETDEVFYISMDDTKPLKAVKSKKLKK